MTVIIIQDDLRLQHGKEMTVCYKWLPWRQLKLVPCFIKSHKLQTQNYCYCSVLVKVRGPIFV